MRRIFAIFLFVFVLFFSALSQNINYRYSFSSDVQFLGFDRPADALFVFDGELKEFLVKGGKLFYARSFNPFGDSSKLLISVSPDRDFIALAQYGGGLIKIYRFSKDLQLVDSLRTEAEIEQFAIAGDYILVGGLYQDTKAIQLYDLKRKRVLAGDLFDDSQEFKKMIVSHTGQYVAFIMQDGLTRRYTLNFYHYNNGVFDNQMSLTTSKPVRDIAFVSQQGDKLLAIVGKDLIKFNGQLAQNEVIRMGKINRLSVGQDFSKVYVSSKRFLTVLQVFPAFKLDTVIKVRNSLAAFSGQSNLWAIWGDNFLKIAKLDTSLRVLDSVFLPVKNVQFKALNNNLLLARHKKQVFAVGLSDLRLKNKALVKAKRFFALDSSRVLLVQGNLLKLWDLNGNSFKILDTVRSLRNLFLLQNAEKLAVAQPNSLKIYRIKDGKVVQIQRFTNVNLKNLAGANLYPTKFVAVTQKGRLITVDFIRHIFKTSQLNLSKTKVLAFNGQQIVARSRDTVKFIQIHKSYNVQTGQLLLKGIKKAYLNNPANMVVLVRPRLFAADLFIYQLPEFKQIFSQKVKKYLFSNDKKSLIIQHKHKKISKVLLIDMD